MAGAGINVPSNGQRTFKIKCFDHEESTPSLVVSTDKQLFNCFGAGCSIGGDVIAFVMHFYRLSFHDSISKLINEFALDVGHLVVEKTAEEKSQDRYAKINYAAAQFFHEQQSKNNKIVAFFKNRGISDQVCREFLVGYSPSASLLIAHLRSKGCTPEDVKLLQFVRDDIFTNRIIYPMRDQYGRITHFYGRAVQAAAVKYIGMSKVFEEKAHPLMELSVPFGLHIARQHVSKDQGRIILVEGHNDVLGLHSHGIQNSCAMMTAAPSEKQYSILHAMNINNIVVCPDGDEAGRRTMELINKNRSTHQHVKIMNIVDGSDPDEFVHKQGTDAFKKLIQEAVYPIEIVIKDVAERYLNAGTTAKFDMANDAIGYMAGLSGFEREFAVGELSLITAIDRDTIEESISLVDESPMVDVELERKVLGECINEKIKAIHAATMLNVEDFTSSRHVTIWKCLLEMIAADIEPFSREMFITFSIDKGYFTDKETDNFHKTQLGGMQSLEYAAKKLKDLTIRRSLNKAASRLLVESKAKKSDITEVLNTHLHSISVSTGSKKDVTTAAEQITRTMDIIHERMSNPGIPGVNIGPNWKKFMHVIMGFQKGHMITVAGVTKAGKTTIAQNWNIQQLIHVGEPTLWINLEMSESDLTMRNLSIMSGVDGQRMKVGNISAEEKNAIDQAAAKYHGFNLHVANMAGANVFDIINCMRRFVYSANIRMVFIDYIQLIRGDRGRSKGNLWEEQNDVVAAIRDAISRLGITGVLISQLNRGAMADQSASGQYVSGTIKLIQDSDCFMGIRKKTKAELEITPHANSSLQIEYNRHGPQGLEIDLAFKYGSMIIREV